MSYGSSCPLAFREDEAVDLVNAAPAREGSEEEEPRPARWSAPALVVAVCAFAVVSAGAVVGGRRRVNAFAPSTLASAATLDQWSLPSRVNITVTNSYERMSGRKTGDGLYPYAYLVEVYQPTLFEVDDLGNLPEGTVTCLWQFGEVVDSTSGCIDSTVTFTSVGQELVTFSAALAQTGETLTYAFNVHVKYVRREIRELTPSDRAAYLGAIQVVYTTTTEEGMQLYGSQFRGSEWLVREHLYGAASKMCDHWHDDAGFLNHHVGITWQFEESIQAVDASVSAHYWDYTIDAEETNVTDVFSASLFFSEDWFGTPSPVNHRHVVDEGRFAYTAVKSNAREFSVITNPYGLLRSPWNTNSAPFLTRYQRVLGVTYDDYSLAGCGTFTDALSEYDSVAAFTSKLNGALHGPIHIMIGGHWWFKNSTYNETLATQTARDMGLGGAPFAQDASAWMGTGQGSRSRMLLASKFLWRQGYARCPETCSSDASWDDCACSCPSEIVGTTDAEAYDTLNKSGLLAINTNWKNPNLFGMSWKDVLDFLCHVGHPGEMFTSAAPQDPTFWPLHGNAERFMHLVRLLNAQGDKDLDETWGYSHVTTGLDSDTHAVCNWTGVEGLNMPECDLGATCPGHHSEDLLPFDLWETQPHKFTNAEFYNYTSPLNKHVPYVYDRLLFWPSCHNQTIWHGNLTKIVIQD